MKRFARLAIVTMMFLGLILGTREHRVRVYAQTLPATKTLAWDVNPIVDAVLNYTVTLDGIVVGNPVMTTQLVTFTTAGAHVLTVTATNIWGVGPAATLNVTVIVPGRPNNVHIQ